jgi:hypothetical protein
MVEFNSQFVHYFYFFAILLISGALFNYFYRSIIYKGFKMTKYQKNAYGHYVIKGRTYQQLFGSRAQVMHGTAYKTTGELTREALIQNKHGRIVSKSKYHTGKNKNKNNLLLNGYTARKGHFGPVKMGSKTARRGRKRGGTTDPSNAQADEAVSKAETAAVMSSAPSMGSVPEGYSSSSLAASAAPISGGGKRMRGGIFLGGSRKKNCRTSRKSRRRGGYGFHALSPADF